MSSQTIIPATTQLHHLQFAHNATKKLIDGIAADKLCAQPLPGMNHALWIAGHLATTDDYFLQEFAGVKMTLPEKWNTLFGNGSTPTTDSSQYPSLTEVLSALENRRGAFVKWYESLSESQLAKAGPEKWSKYAPTLGDVAYFLTWHEGFHCGQLSSLRKAFGLGPAFG